MAHKNSKQIDIPPAIPDTYGLIGYPLGHSFSATYFTEKFYREDIPNTRYQAFPLARIEDLKSLLKTTKKLKGLNVTIPYKTQVIPFLDELDETAKKVGAVNTIKLSNGKLIGYNTDVVGFEQSLKPLLQKYHQKALILGTGGAAQSVIYVLQKLGIAYQLVSRTAGIDKLAYSDLTETHLKEHLLIINTTPLGMAPNDQSFPLIPYEFVNQQHLFYDLVYNPEKTIFLIKGKLQGATIKNGKEMLILQAEKAWDIWQ